MLRIRINSPSLLRDRNDVYYAIADVLPLGESRRTVTPIRGIKVPIGGPNYATVSELQSGSYTIRAKLPSGEVMVQAVDMGDDAKIVEMDAGDSPHEWLAAERSQGLVPSLQDMAAKVRLVEEASIARDSTARAGRDLYRASAPRRTTSKKQAMRGPQTAGASLRSTFDQVERARRQEFEAESYDASVAVAQFAGPAPGWWSGPDVDFAHEAFGTLVYAKGIAPKAEEESGLYSVVELPRLGTKPRRQIPSSLQGMFRQDPAKRNVETKFRTYGILAEAGKISRVACLPPSWRDLRRQPVPVRILFRRGEGTQTEMVPMVDDPKMGSILAYMRRGDLGSASVLITDSLEMLMAKAENPVAAAGAAYILMYSANDSINQDWREWIRNLGRRFPEVPDGKIQHATLLLQRGEPGEVDDAKALLVGAIENGPPYYRLGVKLLLDGLSIVASWEKSAGEASDEVCAALRYANWLTRRVDPRQSFTVLRVGGTSV